MRLTLFLSVLIVAIVSLSGVAIAQDSAPSTEAQQLIDLLENDEARDALIASLKDVAIADEVAV